MTLTRSGQTFAAALTLMLVGMSGPAAADEASLYEAAKKEGELVLYTDQSVELAQQLLGAFAEKYPGISVDFFRGDTAGLTQRFESESATGQHFADVLTATTRISDLWYSKNYIVPYSSALRSLYPADLKAPDDKWNVYGIVTVTWAYNTDLVSADEAPKDWTDLVDPKWKGKISMQDPRASGGARVWVATMYRELGEEKWLEYMQALAAQEPRFGDYFQAREMMASGETAIQVAAYPDYTEPLKAQGAPVEWGVPAEFVIFEGLTLNLSANAPHPNAAKLFIEFMLSPDAQEMIAAANKMPALPEKRPEAFRKLDGLSWRYTANSLLMTEKPEFFQEKINEFFGAN